MLSGMTDEELEAYLRGGTRGYELDKVPLPQAQQKTQSTYQSSDSGTTGIGAAAGTAVGTAVGGPVGGAIGGAVGDTAERVVMGGASETKSDMQREKEKQEELKTQAARMMIRDKPRDAESLAREFGTGRPVRDTMKAGMYKRIATGEGLDREEVAQMMFQPHASDAAVIAEQNKQDVRRMRAGRMFTNMIALGIARALMPF
jgi:hypothetical protein